MQLEQLSFTPKIVTLSVTEVNTYVQKTLAQDPMLSKVSIRGEVSNFKRHSSGHLYFAMKDAESRISCVMFRQNAASLVQPLTDGARIVATGRVSLYPRDGTYQLYVESITQDGVGQLYAKYEALRQRLASEGLFDTSRKRALPRLPRGVGIVTSETGAVIRDIVNVASRRHPGMRLFIYPAKVQGEGAADSVIRGIEFFNMFDGVDVIIIGRGGGSIEDLWAFNEEKLVRAVHASRKVVISAVGHETDTTLSDFAADVRAPTPSAAAELAVPILDDLLMNLADVLQHIHAGAMNAIDTRRKNHDGLRYRLNMREPRNVLIENRRRVGELRQRLDRLAGEICRSKRIMFDSFAARLAALNPKSVTSRGYAIVTYPNGVLIDSNVMPGDRINIEMSDLNVRATVDDYS